MDNKNSLVFPKSGVEKSAPEADVVAPKQQASQAEKLIKVEATLLGWYDRRRVSVGEILEIPEKKFSKVWMKKV